MTYTASQVLAALVLGGLAGVVGQVARIIADFRKTADEQNAQLGEEDLSNASRLVVGLMIGFIAGVIATLSLGLGKLVKFEADGLQLLLGIAAAGYIGADFIEAFAGTLSKVPAPAIPGSLGAPAVQPPPPSGGTVPGPTPAPTPPPPGGHLTVFRTEEEVRKNFGDFDYTEIGGGQIKISDPWPTENVTTITIEQIKRIVPSGKVECHKDIATALKAAFAEVEARGLTDRILAWDGLWVPRHIGSDPNRPLSRHSWAIAFDINARWNGYGHEPAAQGTIGSVIELVPIFEAHGFAWGGYFRPNSIRDGMHFEYCRPVT